MSFGREEAAYRRAAHGLDMSLPLAPDTGVAEILDRLHETPAVLSIMTCDMCGIPLEAHGVSNPAAATLEGYARLLSISWTPPPTLTVLPEGFIVAQVRSTDEERTWALFVAVDTTELDLATFAALGRASEGRHLLGGDAA